MITLAKRLYIWCKRFRHRCGYNVHSPSDFFLITSVIYEQYHYYAYKDLKKSKLTCKCHYRRKVYELLFRLVNYMKPESVVDIACDNGLASLYMGAASKKMQIHYLGDTYGNNVDKIKTLLKEKKRFDCIHIGFTENYREIADLAMNYADEKSIIIVGTPYSSREKEAWWKELVKDDRAVISFDLYDIGIILFPKKRYKQNYIVNFL